MHTCICMHAYACIHAYAYIHTSRKACDASQQPFGFGPRRRPNYTIEYSHNQREQVKNKSPFIPSKTQSPLIPVRAKI